MSTEIYDKTNDVRDVLFSSLGKVDTDVIAHLINPAFMGGPQWPTLRQAFSIIRTDDSIKVVSTGLSDPFDDVEEPNNGFKIEIIAETTEDLGDDISSSWLFKLVYSISRQAAHNGKMAEFIANHGVITMELFAEDDGLDEFQNENGMVGVMIGVEHPDIPKIVQFPAEEIILATVQILTPDELEYAVEYRAEGRNHLHELMKKSGIYHYIIPNRQSLLKGVNPSSASPWWKFWDKS
ncbi:suppressor of fused domain protein [Enterovibrio norvegicus]|uniref:hypothetical protein n=1 Tax=Enterovibrio norvegicus TaxID=188144 RepID=UPI003D0B9A51